MLQQDDSTKQWKAFQRTCGDQLRVCATGAVNKMRNQLLAPGTNFTHVDLQSGHKQKKEARRTSVHPLARARFDPYLIRCVLASPQFRSSARATARCSRRMTTARS